MTNKIIWGAIVVGLTAVAGCSSSNSSGSNSNGGGSGSGGGTNSCIASLTGGTGGSSTCGSCESTNCSSQESGVETGCSDLLACICPGGTYNASLIGSCAAKAEEATCTSASQAMSACSSAHCASECNGSSTPDSGGGGTGATVYSCQVASANTCYVFQNGAPENSASDSLQCEAQMGGTSVTSCPTAGLLGCCVFNSPSDYECFYTGSGVTSCPGGPGGFSTTTLP